MKWILSALLLITSIIGYGQRTSIYRTITNSNGTVNTWTMYPVNYDPAKKYPLWVFIPGSGEIGVGTFSTDSTRIYRYGPLRSIKNNTWDGKMKLRQIDGTDIDTSCIVVGLQPRTVTTSRLLIRPIDTILKRNEHDSMVMVVTGLSMGGQAWNQQLMWHDGSTNPNLSYDQYTPWSAAVIFSTPKPVAPANVDSLIFWLQKGGLYFYGIGADDWASYLRPPDLATFQAQFPGQIFAYTYPGQGHNSWQNQYTGTYLTPDSNMTIYDQAGLRTKYPQAIAQSTINTNTNSTTINGKIRGYAAVYSYTQISGPNTATITDNGDTTATISGLVNGVYQIRLRSRNGKGLSASFADFITTITVSSGRPNPKYFYKKAGSKAIFVPTNP